VRPDESRQMSRFCACLARRAASRLGATSASGQRHRRRATCVAGRLWKGSEHLAWNPAALHEAIRSFLPVYPLVCGRERNRVGSHKTAVFLLERGLSACYSSRAHLMFLPSSVRQTAQSLGRLSTDAPENTAKPLSGGTQSGRADDQRRFHQGIITQAHRFRGPWRLTAPFLTDPPATGSVLSTRFSIERSWWSVPRGRQRFLSHRR
jgi:hypothetical protein